MNEIKEFILNNNIILIVTVPFAKSLLITNILNELSIMDKNKTVLFSFNIRCEYYFQKLMSFLSGINFRLINKYLYPYATLNKNNFKKISRDKFMDSIEKIQNSNIIMIDEKGFIARDYISYILNYKDVDVLIIDDFYSFLNKKIYDLDELFRFIVKEKGRHFVFVVVEKRNEHNKIVEKINKYIKNFVLVDGDNYLDYKDVKIKIISEIKEKKFNLKFNKNNKIITNMKESCNE